MSDREKFGFGSMRGAFEWPGPVTDRMVAAMDEKFPVKLPTPESSERQDVFAAGQRSVVDFLRQARNWQQDTQDVLSRLRQE